jgi:putative RecB family exonuclease
MKTLLKGWTTPSRHSDHRVRKYSTTSDILSFKRCRRQYGFFGVRGFASATATQRYFGTLVHDVLDRINRDYRLDPVLPSEAHVTQLVEEAHDRLIRSGVRPYSIEQQKDAAAKLTHRFVALLGAGFFPHVQQTEYRLERALKTPTERDYILSGIVDVLSGAVSHALGLNFGTTADDVEIWDYKSGRMPEPDSDLMDAYTYQMRVYAELYRQQTGRYPARSVLVFVGELGDDRFFKRAQGDLAGNSHFIYPIAPVPDEVETAISDFHQTVEAIESERAKPYAEQWGAPDHPVEAETCEACELRFKCDSYPAGARLRAEAL